MRVNAQILSINNNSGVSKKTGKEYSINELFLIDTEAPRPEVIKVSVHENDLTAARSLVGKTVPCQLFSNSGNFRFGGQIVQSAAKAV